VFPNWKANLFTTWTHPLGVSAGVNVRYVGAYQECDGNNCNDPDNLRRDVDWYLAGDLFASYQFKSSQGTTSITAGMNNVTNTTPPLVYNNTAQDSDARAYDFLGRQFYIRLGQAF
jgi:outer membrane receptor for ferrienterochelin and colicin